MGSSSAKSSAWLKQFEIEAERVSQLRSEEHLGEGDVGG